MVTAAAQAQRVKEGEITEQDSLLLTRNLLRIAIFNISYIRGLFPESYFNDKSVPALEMKIKKLMPMDAESRRLIDWMEKGVYDALQKKYLRTLLFCICESESGPLIEEYAFSFSYCSSSSEVSMNVNRIGNKKQGTTFKSNSADFTPNHIRSCACKMVRTLVQLMRTLDRMPEERTVLMKLYYYDDITPPDYEPPFFRCSAEEEGNQWSRTPLKMKVGGVDSKHFMIALKVKSVLDPCEDENVNIYEDMNESHEEDSENHNKDASETLSETVEENERGQEGQELDDDVTGRHRDLQVNHSNDMVTEDERKDDPEEYESVKDWLRSRHIDTVDITDVLSEFPDIPVASIEGIIDTLVKQEFLMPFRKDKYIIQMRGKADDVSVPIEKEVARPSIEGKDYKPVELGDEDMLYAKALYYVLPMDYVTISKLQTKFKENVNQYVIRKLLEKMSLDGYIEGRASSNRRQGRRVIRSERTKQKFIELKGMWEGQLKGKEEASHAPVTVLTDKDTSTNARLHSLGSELTRHGESPRNASLKSGQMYSNNDGFKKPASPACPQEMDKPTVSRESTAKHTKTGFGTAAQMEMENMRCSQGTTGSPLLRSRKSSTVNEPIYQNFKRLKS